MLSAPALLLDNGQRLGLIEASQVEEVGLLAVFVEDGAPPVLEFRGSEDGNAVWGQGLSQSQPSVGILLRGDARRDCTQSELADMSDFVN